MTCLYNARAWKCAYKSHGLVTTEGTGHTRRTRTFCNCLFLLAPSGEEVCITCVQPVTTYGAETEPPSHGSGAWGTSPQLHQAGAPTESSLEFRDVRT